MVLVLDAFEQCQNIAEQADNLNRFLKHIDDWPPCHFLIAVRRPAAEDAQGELEGYRQANKLCTSHGRLAQIQKLGPIDLSDLTEQDRVRIAIREALPEPRAWFDDLNREWLFECLDGYPETLMRWQRYEPTSKEEMEEIASDAKSHQNRHLKQALIKVRDENRDLFKVAIRIALLPELRADTWEAFRTIVLDGIENQNDALADLCTHGVLAHMEPPSFGHTTAYESARRFITIPLDDANSNLSNYAPDQIRYLIRSCAERVRSVDSESYPYAKVLLYLLPIGEELTVDDAHLGLCFAAVCLLSREALVNTSPKWLDRLYIAAKAASKKQAGMPPVLPALALTNAIAHSGSDFNRTDTLIKELHDLHTTHSDTDSAVREQFANGLINAIYDSGSDFNRTDTLLKELRDLYTTHGGTDSAVREQFASGLNNAIYDSGSDFNRTDTLLKELRDLYTTHGDTDSAVREQFANGLTNAIYHSGSDFNRTDTLLKELRDLYTTYGDTDSAVREPFANGLFNAFNNSEPNSTRADDFLKELRDLYTTHGDTDSAVREQLANGLCLWMIQCLKSKENLQDNARDAYDELKRLYKKHPDDEGILKIWKYANDIVTDL